MFVPFGRLEMNDQAQAMMARSEPHGPAAAPPVSSTVKTILLHVQDDSALEARIEAALSLARATSAHLSCLNVRPVQAYVAADSYGGIFVMDDLVRSFEGQDARLRSTIEAKLRSEDVSWDYAQTTGDVAASTACQAALADLVVTGRAPQKDEFAAPATGLLGQLLYRVRSPLFIPGDGTAALDVTGSALVAWDGTYEAANAVRASLGLLRLARSVNVLRVAEAKGEAFPDTKVLEYLSRQGIHVEFTTLEPPAGGGDAEAIAATLVSHARDIGAAYMVMGGYSHSRVRELAFGGVTRTLLKSCPLSLLIAH